jgi:hypothetical protein
LTELVALSKEENRRKTEKLETVNAQFKEAETNLQNVRQELRESQYESEVKQDKIGSQIRTIDLIRAKVVEQNQKLVDLQVSHKDIIVERAAEKKLVESFKAQERSLQNENIELKRCIVLYVQAQKKTIDTLKERILEQASKIESLEVDKKEHEVTR